MTLLNARRGEVHVHEEAHAVRDLRHVHTHTQQRLYLHCRGLADVRAV